MRATNRKTGSVLLMLPSRRLVCIGRGEGGYWFGMIIRSRACSLGGTAVFHVTLLEVVGLRLVGGARILLMWGQQIVRVPVEWNGCFSCFLLVGRG